MKWKPRVEDNIEIADVLQPDGETTINVYVQTSSSRLQFARFPLDRPLKWIFDKFCHLTIPHCLQPSHRYSSVQNFQDISKFLCTYYVLSKQYHELFGFNRLKKIMKYSTEKMVTLPECYYLRYSAYLKYLFHHSILHLIRSFTSLA